MDDKRYVVFFIIASILLCISPSSLFAQTEERGIITLQDAAKLLSIIANLESSVTNHEWEMVFKNFFEPNFTNPYKAGDKWKNLEWMAVVFYPEIKPATSQDSVRIANSIKSFKHFILDVQIYKTSTCEFQAIVRGVRTIDFEPGKKYIPIEMKFCLTGEAWLLTVQ